MTQQCLQYYYPPPPCNDEEPCPPISQEALDNFIKCNSKIFVDFNNPLIFNNKNFLDFIKKYYASTYAFPNLELSPFEFSENYINKSTDEICNLTSYKLNPQQKFSAQFINPLTNFHSELIFHGLGSGKTCTSIVIGEAFKKDNIPRNQRITIVVPAPLKQQYFDEIVGKIKNGDVSSCPSQCIINKGGIPFRDFYTTVDDEGIIEGMRTDYNRLIEQKKETLKLLETVEGGEKKKILSTYDKIENELSNLKLRLIEFEEKIKGNVAKVFEITTHTKFISSLFKTDKQNKTFIKSDYLKADNALFHENGVLIIDEIQRLISEGGTFYTKLYNMIKYYAHPKLRVILLSATPIYDNPYELALTMNILRPRIPLPTKKEDFYKMFIGEKDEKGKCVISDTAFLKDNSCVINHNYIAFLCSGYVSYFKGGNPNAYPYKRIITMFHDMAPNNQKKAYVSALNSDIKKDSKFKNKDDLLSDPIYGSYQGDGSEDKVSGIYVTTQQISNISLLKSGEFLSTQGKTDSSLASFKNLLFQQKNIGEISRRNNNIY